MRTLSKSLAVGLGAALVWMVLGLIGEDIIVPRFLHKTTAPSPSSQGQPASPSGGDFRVTTHDELVSEVSWDDPYLLPSALAVLVVTSAWAYRRFRMPATRE